MEVSEKALKVSNSMIKGSKAKSKWRMRNDG